MNGRKPDAVDEAFRHYGIIWGLPRVARTFRDMGVPLSLAVNAEFPEHERETWELLRALIPHAPVIAHGINNSTALLPLTEGPAAQRAYIHQTIDRIERSTGIRSIGWSSPSVYPNAGTFAATAAEGVRYSLDGMDSDILSRLGTAPPLILVPYPPTVVDMGQYLSRTKEAIDLERLWKDYVDELVREAETYPRPAATLGPDAINPAMRFSGNGLECQSCHLEAGTKKFALRSLASGASSRHSSPAKTRFARSQNGSTAAWSAA